MPAGTCTHRTCRNAIYCAQRHCASRALQGRSGRPCRCGIHVPPLPAVCLAGLSHVQRAPPEPVIDRWHTPFRFSTVWRVVRTARPSGLCQPSSHCRCVAWATLVLETVMVIPLRPARCSVSSRLRLLGLLSVSEDKPPLPPMLPSSAHAAPHVDGGRAVARADDDDGAGRPVRGQREGSVPTGPSEA